MKLTDKVVRAAKPGPKPRKLTDGLGLYLLVHSNGGKYWRLKYRVAGREKTLALGTYPAVKLATARRGCMEAREQLAQGIDPSAVRKAKKAAGKERATNSFELIAREWFNARSPNWVPSHADKIIRRLERDVFPYVSNRAITTITAAEWLAVMQRIAGRGAVETARRALSNVGQIYRFSMASGRAETDVSKVLWDAMPAAQGTHLASVTDPQRVGDLLRMIWNYEGSPVVAAALKFAPYTFVRPGELRTAQWADIDLKTSEWRFTASKTGTEHVVPLSRQAIEVLRELHPLTGCGRFVFPSARGKGRAMSNMAVNAAMRRLGIDKATFTGHGWRAAARTILDEVLNFRPDFIEHQLAHAVRDPNGRAYNRTAFLPERHKMMQAWSDYLDGLRADTTKK